MRATASALSWSCPGTRCARPPTGRPASTLALRLQPDVVLIDIGLPGLDGYDVARRIRSTPQGHLMVLAAVTGYGQPEDRRRAEEAGFDALLVKPVDPDQLTQLLATAGRDQMPATPMAGRRGAARTTSYDRRRRRAVRHDLKSVAGSRSVDR